MNKIKFQRIWSKTSGIRHKMIWQDETGYFIKNNLKIIPITHIDKDLWKIKEGSGSKDLINCYCTYKWDYDSIEEMYDKWEEDDSTLHTMVVFRADGVVLILTDNDKEEKISYATFVKYINDGSIGELYDWEVE